MNEIIWMLRYFRQYLSPKRQLSLWRNNIKAWQRFWESYGSYKSMALDDEQPLLKNLYPCLGDDTAETVIEPTYFYQDCWAFEKIVNNRPQNHVDIGSHHKFVALLSKVVPVTMVDIRPLSLPLETLNFKKGSILELPFEDNSVESISSLCVVEHIGLGRYGDPLDPYGSEKAINELKRVLKPGGHLYFSVPVLGNKNITFFNAHRSFSETYIKTIFAECNILEKKYIYGRTYTNQEQNDKFGIGLYQIQKL
ncbi:MAG: DUF268 domain-containing protein [Gomphosphaeria aponina SAG 52.96 = DSM 107014]|uniref:DUF268 domain-containing protein n=1 Tax=Gomphosphaeria aponina SAG 52.96 = DSM 107014 TaxID=1521640 RepID=A0A941GTX6_9CHRO|nr:DUF268 domain-containing protein [Gomphosphaeria aponina SAG 52.96 = DSM 107014]